MDTSLRVAYGPEIAAAALRHHLDPRLLAAVAAQETGGPGRDSGRNVVGDGGHGRGLFQIDDRSHAFARSPAAMDPASNADYAARLIAGNLSRYGGDVRAALSAYNTGSPTAAGTRTDWGDGKQLTYADSVLRHYLRLAGGGAPDAQGAGAEGRDAALRVDGLRGAASLLAPGSAPALPGDPAAGSPAAFPPLMAFSPPPIQHLAVAVDQHDQRDLAPTTELNDPTAT